MEQKSSDKKRRSRIYAYFSLLILILLSCNLSAPNKSIPASNSTLSPESSLTGRISHTTISSENANQLVQIDRKGFGDIQDISISNDGRYIALASSSGILILDSTGLTDLHFIKTDNIVSKVIFSPDSTTLASMVEDGSIRLWKVEDGSFLLSLNTNLNGNYEITHNKFVFSPDGQFIASGGYTENEVSIFICIFIWNVKDGSIAKKLISDSFSGVPSLDYSPDGTFIAAGYMESGFVTIWDVNEARPINSFHVYEFAQQGVTGVKFLPGGNQLLVGDAVPRITFWNFMEGKQVGIIKQHSFTNAFLSPDMSQILFVDNGILNILNIQSGEFLDKSGWELGEVMGIAIYPDGAKIALLERTQDSQNINLEIRQLSDGTIIKSREFGDYIIDHLAFLSDGKLMSVGLDKLNCSLLVGRFMNESVTFQNITNENNDECPNSVLVSTNGNTAATITENGIVTLNNLIDIGSPVSIANENHSLLSLVLSPDGTLLATGEYDSDTSAYTVNIRYTADGTIKKSLEGFTNIIVGLAFSPNDSSLAIVTADGNVKLWDTENSSLLSTANLGSEGISLLSDWALISFPSDEFLVFSEEKKVLLWDIRENRFQYTLDPEAYYSSALKVGFSPDNKLIAVGDGDGKITIWSVDDGAKLIVLKGHTAGIKSVIFSPDGSELISGSDDGTILVWGIGP